MSRLVRILSAVFGRASESKVPQQEREQLEALATELSKKELKFSDSDIKRIAHNIIDLDRDADRLAARIIKSRGFWIPLIIGLLVSGILGFFTIWIKISGKVDQQI